LIVGKSKTENGTGRVIPLNQRLLAVLEMWSESFPKRTPDDYVFPAEKYGAATNEFKPCVYGTDPSKPVNDWKEAWEAAKKRSGAALLLNAENRGPAGIVTPSEAAALKCRFHDLRHTACTRLLEGGVPYPVVSSIMGWSASTAIRMAKRYAHIGHKALRDAMELLGNVETPKESPKEVPKVGNLGSGCG
jgi:integrase